MIFRYTVICLMALIVLFVIHLLIIKINDIEAFPPDGGASKTPSGLYEATDKVALLTVNNFHENVYNSTSAWLVQFYNSWCGHCIKFSPIWKQLAASIYNWRSVIVIGAIDCADEQNTQHCREYDILAYPTIRYFQPLIENFTTGKDLDKIYPDPAALRGVIIELLQNTETKVPNWPDFSTVNSDTLKSLWKDNDSKLLILVVEGDESITGRELILDLRGVKDLMVRYTFNADFASNKENLPEVFAIKPDLSRKPISLSNKTRTGVFESVREFLMHEGYDVPNVIEIKSNVTEHVKVKQSDKQLQLVNKVFVEDLESALSFSLLHEVSLKPNIADEAMVALKDYLHVVNKYFPANSKIRILLDALINDLRDKSSISGGNFKTLVSDHATHIYSLKHRHWVGCKGSTAKYRGYPCSVWMTFHTLTVQAYVKNQNSPSSDATEVLNAMTNYIKNFFGCHDCAEHFQSMSKTISGNVSSHRDSVLWLWKAHNTVNNRLKGDFSEDPAFPKIQFPVAKMCPQCRHADKSWNEDEVLSYLLNMYTHIYDVVTLPSGESSTELAKFNSERFVQEKQTSDGWNFSLSDVNTCIGLYVLSACLFTVYSVKFFLKRNRRSRTHKYDFYNKA